MRELSSAELSLVNGGSLVGDCGVEVAGYVLASASLTVAAGPVGWGLAVGGWALSAYSAQNCLGGGGSDVYVDEYGCHQAS